MGERVVNWGIKGAWEQNRIGLIKMLMCFFFYIEWVGTQDTAYDLKRKEVSLKREHDEIYINKTLLI